MISKELLSKILFGKQKIDYIINKNSEYGIYYQTNNLNGESFINFYELGDKSKTWLELQTEYDVVIIENKVYLLGDIWTENEVWCEKEWKEHPTWWRNMLEACQWISEDLKD